VSTHFSPGDDGARLLDEPLIPVTPEQVAHIRGLCAGQPGEAMLLSMLLGDDA
jgi:hypothetical protein